MNDDKSIQVRKDPGFWREIWQQIRLVFRLIADPEVPIYLKIVPFITLIYLIIPIDLLPDVAPVLGQIDDVAFLLAGSKIFLELVPPHIIARHMQEIRQRDGYFTGEMTVSDTTPPLEDTIIIDSEHEIILEDDETN
ncbi:MAG: DUF1232 domain-containing protein [Ardenticatenaceae bacterium]|nr:DUF1232 domain-containing protein [Ardenticatenaceae bacterium]